MAVFLRSSAFCCFIWKQEAWHKNFTSSWMCQWKSKPWSTYFKNIPKSSNKSLKSTLIINERIVMEVKHQWYTVYLLTQFFTAPPHHHHSVHEHEDSAQLVSSSHLFYYCVNGNLRYQMQTCFIVLWVADTQTFPLLSLCWFLLLTCFHRADGFTHKSY